MAKWLIWVSLYWSALIQVMAYCLLGAKPLPETMGTFCQLNTHKHVSITFDPIQTFLLKNIHLKCRLQNYDIFCRAINVLTFAFKVTDTVITSKYFSKVIMISAYLHIPPDTYILLIYHQTNQMLYSSNHVPIWQDSPHSDIWQKWTCKNPF